MPCIGVALQSVLDARRADFDDPAFVSGSDLSSIDYHIRHSRFGSALREIEPLYERAKALAS